jgi:hypothetical protein
LSTTAFAIILHPNGEPDGTWTNRPSDLVVGRWSSNASFVVIAPDWLATTRHQDTSPATVTIDGIAYNCHYDPQWAGGLSGNADIQVVRLTTANNQNPNLTNFAEIYAYTDEIDQPIVIGGYGNARGDALTKGNTVYGYTWDYVSGNSSPLRWGTNTIDDTDTTTTGYISDIVIADFDKLTADPDDYECINAIHDSGGGWFIFNNSQWKTAGLVRAIEAHGDNWPSDAESWFRDPDFPASTAHPDYFDAVRLSSYAPWIDAIITCTGDMPGDTNQDCIVNFEDLILLASQWLADDCDAGNNNCSGADTNPTDGYVEFFDFATIAADWLKAN